MCSSEITSGKKRRMGEMERGRKIYLTLDFCWCNFNDKSITYFGLTTKNLLL
jgi:hypothetical protein